MCVIPGVATTPNILTLITHYHTLPPRATNQPRTHHSHNSHNHASVPSLPLLLNARLFLLLPTHLSLFYTFIINQLHLHLYILTLPADTVDLHLLHLLPLLLHLATCITLTEP